MNDFSASIFRFAGENLKLYRMLARLLVSKKT